MRHPSTRLQTLGIFLGALLLFCLRLTAFEARPTDVSALRVMAGEVPYRDFWTMYAPGSFVVLGGVFHVVGAQLIVSNLLGILASAAGVAVFFRLARIVTGPFPATCVAGLVAASYFGAGYADGFTSYPPAFLLIAVAVHLAASGVKQDGAAWAIRPGLVLGAAALFKHDVAAYTALSLCVALVLLRRHSGLLQALGPAIVLGIAASLLPLLAILLLVRLGAGPDAWVDLVRFPLGDFKYVRSEYFPVALHLQNTLVGSVRELRGWVICNLPTAAVLAGLLGFRRARTHVDRPTALLVTFATIVFACHWWAAHIQINTNAISLAAWGGLVGAAGLHRARWANTRVAAGVMMVLAGWTALLLAEPVYLATTRMASGNTPIGLPHLRGVRTTPDEAAWMRDLALAMEDAGPREAPLLFASSRNDMVIYAQSVPFWLTDRRPATRHSELHPGVTDTVAAQTQMIERLSKGRLPVVVREYRFDNATLDSAMAEIRRHVPVGSPLLDQWLARHYVAGGRYGRYEVMAPRVSSVLQARP